LKYRETHSVPYFEGEVSHRHHDVPLWRLAIQALPATLRHAKGFTRADTFAQFVGFPRSGHSLIGSIVDAHPSAVVAHELDVMGLIDKGVPLASIYGMIARNAQAFTRSGRYWNGYRYIAPQSSHAVPAGPALVGDKKGDWAVRRCARDPSLLKRSRRLLDFRDRWILVVRHPADNIATMSLRQGGTYDALRIAGGAGEFALALRGAQADGRVPDSADDGMIDDYEALCETIVAMKAQVPAARWHIVVYEHFALEPFAEISALYRFLGLPVEESFVASAASIVVAGKSRSRERVSWRAGQERRVRAMIDRFDFLKAYRSAT